MRIELTILLIVALVGAIPLIAIEKTGMQALSGPTLADFPYLFGEDFNAVIIEPEETNYGVIKTKNLLLSVIPVYYRITQRPRWGEGYYQIFTEQMAGKTFKENEIDYTKTDAIIIGMPNNNIVYKLLTQSGISPVFNKGEGAVILTRQYNHNYIIFTGYGGDEIFETARYFLSEAQLGKVYGRELRVADISQIQGVPIRTGDPNWQAGYSSQTIRTTQKNEINILGQRFNIQ